MNDEEYQNDDKKMNHRNSMANLMAATQRLTSRLDGFVKKAETLKEREDRELTKCKCIRDMLSIHILIKYIFNSG